MKGYTLLERGGAACIRNKLMYAVVGAGVAVQLAYDVFLAYGLSRVALYPVALLALYIWSAWAVRAAATSIETETPIEALLEAFYRLIRHVWLPVCYLVISLFSVYVFYTGSFVLQSEYLDWIAAAVALVLHAVFWALSFFALPLVVLERNSTRAVLTRTLGFVFRTFYTLATFHAWFFLAGFVFFYGLGVIVLLVRVLFEMAGYISVFHAAFRSVWTALSYHIMFGVYACCQVILLRERA